MTHEDENDMNEYLSNTNEFMIIDQMTTELTNLTNIVDTQNKGKNKVVDKSFIDLVFSELHKVNEIDTYIDTIEDTLNSPDVLNRMQTKELMRWYELMNVRKNHTRKFLMAFYELSSKNEYMSKIMTQMTGKEIDPKSLEQDDKTKTVKTIVQKLMQEKLKDH